MATERFILTIELGDDHGRDFAADRIRLRQELTSLFPQIVDAIRRGQEAGTLADITSTRFIGRWSIDDTPAGGDEPLLVADDT